MRSRHRRKCRSGRRTNGPTRSPPPFAPATALLPTRSKRRCSESCLPAEGRRGRRSNPRSACVDRPNEADRARCTRVPTAANSPRMRDADVQGAVDAPIARTRARHPALARDHEPGRIRPQGLGDQCLAEPRPVGIRSVDKSHPAVGYLAQQGDRFALVGWRSPHSASGDAHGSKAKAADRWTVSES